MTKIRLLRMGCHKNPFFRLVVTDQRAKANGKYIELVGNYNPFDGKVVIDEYIAIKWLATGAQPTDTARSLLQKQGIWKKFIELKDSKQLATYLEEEMKKRKANVTKKLEIDEAKKLEAEKKRQELKKIAAKKAEEKRLAEEAARRNEEKRLAEEAAKKAAAEKEVKLQIKEDSKIIKKISKEELEKRETQKFEVIEHDQVVGEETPRTIMISLDKEEIEKIISDEKEILFFKRLPVQKVERVLVYSIKPIGKVVGEFDLKSTNVLSKTKSWKEFGSRSVFRKKDFDEYFEGQEDVKIMELDGFIKYSKDRPLSDFKLTRGPSGFCYLK